MTPNQAPTSSASNHVSGFSGLLAALQKDYQTKGASVCDLLDRLIAQENGLSAIEQWKNLLEENISSFSSCLDSCLEMMLILEEKVRIGQLSLANEQVCTDVAETEARVLSSLTVLQRLNSEALQPVFTLSLPSVLKTLSADRKPLLRDAIIQQTDHTQYFSNELQHLAIMLKERNKTITHPLDENHPE